MKRIYGDECGNGYIMFWTYLILLKYMLKNKILNAMLLYLTIGEHISRYMYVYICIFIDTKKTLDKLKHIQVNV